LIFALGRGVSPRAAAHNRMPGPVSMALAAPAPATKPEPEPAPEPSPVTIRVEASKTRIVSGKAYLDFMSGRSEILPDYKNNAAELGKIDATISEILSDPGATITGITITGFASPEGSASSNQILSERRARSLRSHIEQTHGLRNILFAVNGAGEDWASLEAMIAASALPGRDRLIEVVRGGGDADSVEGKLRRLGDGELYRRLRDEIYPRLRRTDYTIHYTVHDR
jgi:outer membrane protein OmpA-like peptidoglycan-associated protein